MIRWLVRLIVGAVKLVKWCLLASTLALSVYILSTAAQLETAYFWKYENAHAQCIREHDRQRFVEVQMRARRTVELQADAMRIAFLREQEEKDALIKLMKQREMQVAMFMQTLQRIDPEALQRTREALKYIPPPKKGKE